VDQDQHSGADHGASDAQEPAADPAAPEPTPGAEPDPGARPDVIMSKLPRTRPQRATGRRQREPGTASRDAAAQKRNAAAKRTPVRTGGAAARSAPGRPQSRAGTAARAAKQGTTAARATRPSEAAARRRPATAGPAAQAPRRAVPAPRSGGGSAPGLPRLAIDGAVEAAKLPLKVSGRLTLRALDAVARGLRGG
jgi:hypothetical protein